MGNTVITCLLIFTFILFNARCCNCNSTLMCKPSERTALLNFKHNLTYFNPAVGWEGDECCEWIGVVCDSTTGHILELDLSSDKYFGFNTFFKMEKLESLVYLLELRQLETLDLSKNDFAYRSIPRFMGAMRQLRYLDLSSAYLGGLVPYELGNLTNLESISLSNNMLSGEIPSSLGKLSSLKELDLSFNNLSSIASSLRFPSNLESLDLSENHLSGKIPTLIGKLSKLQTLYISHNPLEGTVLSESHFVNLSSLSDLDMSDTTLILNLSSDWVPPFQLQFLFASNCKINGQLPPWLQTQKNLAFLDLSDANLFGLMPSWFHTMQLLNYVDLSNNKLSGSPIFPINFMVLDLSNNSLSGEFLSIGTKTDEYDFANLIDFTNNFISGPLPDGLDHIMPNLEALFLSNNQISGQIPNSFCQLTLLTLIDMNNNSISGEIPNCLGNFTSLSFVRLSYNNLTGHIPCFSNYSFGPFIEFHLRLNDNMLSGEIPSCLSDLTNLKVLDIGENQLSGKMFKWFNAENFRELQIFRLRGNKFSGTIPEQICSLPHLQIMDLAHNHFTGSIPRCLSNLTSMTSSNASQMTKTEAISDDETLDVITGVHEVIQGIEYAYTSTLPYLVDIDLSFNNLAGSIPDDMTKISGLLNLNLSYNQLSGTIPVNIGGLKSLVSLDLSNNNLMGSIPTSIGQIYRLSHLNLSYNNLSGPIPTGNQLQVLSDQASIYAGNPYLCGDALPKKCKSIINEQGKGRSNEGKGGYKGKLEKMGLYLVVMSGFATGFWGVVGSLALNRRWRHAVFRRLEEGYNWLYVIIVVKVRVVKAKINRISTRC